MSLQKKRREPPFQVKGVIIFFLVVLALCVYTFYFLVPSPPKKKPEFISTPKPKRPPELKIKDYTATCRQINQKILLCAKDLGAHEKDFRIFKEQSLQSKGKRWIHTEAEIYFPRNVDLSEAAQTLVEELKDFPGLSSKREKEENQVFLIAVVR